jgi:hypothetical protein
MASGSIWLAGIAMATPVISQLNQKWNSGVNAEFFWGDARLQLN